MYMNGGGDGVDKRRDRVSILTIVVYGEIVTLSSRPLARA
jgi:hypothetical protein